MNDIIKSQSIENLIYEIRGQRVMLDRDLAILYHVETKTLNQAVKRNISRFPEDFMFQLTKEELDFLRSQIVTSKTEQQEKRGGIRYLPHAFTENGVAMLSSVLHSEIAINVNIRIMRTFTRIRQSLITNTQSDLRFEKIEHKVDNIKNYIEEILQDINDTHDIDSRRMDGLEKQLDAVNDALAQLSFANSQDFVNSQRKRIKGFSTNNEQ